MKKAVAIFLLFLFLFNFIGYRFLFNYAQQKADVQLATVLDNNEYNDAELITIKVPLSMPYQRVQSDFERVDGEITVEGKIYKYVKRKIEAGEMVLLCLPDHGKMRIQTARDDYFKVSNDVAQSNNGKQQNNSKTLAFKNILSDFDPQTFSYSLACLSPFLQHSTSRAGDKLLFLPHTPPVPPPNAA